MQQSLNNEATIRLSKEEASIIASALFYLYDQCCGLPDYADGIRPESMPGDVLELFLSQVLSQGMHPARYKFKGLKYRGQSVQD